MFMAMIMSVQMNSNLGLLLTVRCTVAIANVPFEIYFDSCETNRYVHFVLIFMCNQQRRYSSSVAIILYDIVCRCLQVQANYVRLSLQRLISNLQTKSF